MSSREILTLQFGHYANFVGTHWWNVQEASFNYSTSCSSDIDHDVLFREGLNLKGQVTFTPRMLLTDLKESLKALPELGTLYEDCTDPSEVAPVWDESLVEVKQETAISKNSFQTHLELSARGAGAPKHDYDFEKEVEVWSDFLYTRFHPRSINVIKDYQHGHSQSQFDVFPLGTDLWKTEQFSNDFSDKMRNYIEECDSFQGFHILLDATNSFAGLATSCIEYIKDEYDTKSVLAFPIIPAHFPDNAPYTDEDKVKSIINDSLRVLNLGFCFDSLAESSSLFVPLCTSSDGWRQPGTKLHFNHIDYHHKLPYHTSAILAAALDTATLPYRLKNSHYSLVDVCADFNSHGRKAAAASLCFPFSLNLNTDLIECLNDWEGPLTRCITPRCTLGTDYVMQVMTVRGVPENRLKRPPNAAGKQKDLAAYQCNTVKEMLSLYLSCEGYGSANHVTTVNQNLATKAPFPQFFDDSVGFNGNIIAKKRPKDLGVEYVPTLAGFHTGAGVGEMIGNLHTETKRIKFARFHQFSQSGIEYDDYQECLHRLENLRENYEDRCDL